MHSGLVHALDLDSDGKRLGFLSIPVSVDRSPYFQVKVPVATIRNGEGPRVLLMAGVHGDEYEGELSLARLIRKLDPARMKGLVTIVPMANAPAVMAARRCSPLDGGNLNRAFPGDPLGTPTSRLAHFLEKELMPRHEVLLDIHSGGTSMEHLPVALTERNQDAALERRAVDLLAALGFAHGFVADNGVGSPTSMGAARRAGIIGLSGEFGGGGTATVDSMAITMRAIDNLLVALGTIEAPLLGDGTKPAAPMRLMALGRHSQGLYATRRGWFEPAVRLGETVEPGALAGWYHDLERLDVAEEPRHLAEGGIVISRRLHSHCEAGDCLLQVAEPV
jgi:uncharacterized protein